MPSIPTSIEYSWHSCSTRTGGLPTQNGDQLIVSVCLFMFPANSKHVHILKLTLNLEPILCSTLKFGSFKCMIVVHSVGVLTLKFSQNILILYPQMTTKGVHWGGVTHKMAIILWFGGWVWNPLTTQKLSSLHPMSKHHLQCRSLKIRASVRRDFGHIQSSSKCFQVQAVTCWYISVFLY